MILPREAENWCEFTEKERQFFEKLLCEVLGTEGQGSDECCDVYTLAHSNEIAWYCDYSVSGCNYCDETEYTKIVTLRIPKNPEDRTGFEQVTSLSVGMDCQGVEEMLFSFIEHSDEAWMKINPQENGCRCCSDVAFLFENLLNTGRTVWVQYCYNT